MAGIKTEKMFRIAVGLLILAVGLVVGTFIYYKGAFQLPETVVNGPIQQKMATDFSGSQPSHGDMLNQPPKEIVIGSKGKLRQGSTVYITRTNARELGFGEGSATIDTDGYTLRYGFSSSLSPTDWKGIYTVTYKLCTVACSTGQFQFTVTENGSEGNVNMSTNNNSAS